MKIIKHFIPLMILCSTMVTGCTNPFAKSSDPGEDKQEVVISKDLVFKGVDEINNGKIIEGKIIFDLVFNVTISNENINDIQKTTAGNYIKFNNKFISDIAGASVNVQAGTKVLRISLPESYSLSDGMILKISDQCVIGTHYLPSILLNIESGKLTAYKEYFITTINEATIIKNNSNYSLKFKNEITAGKETTFDASKFSCGTYLIRRSHFLNSGSTSIDAYIKNYAPGNNTYKDYLFTGNLTKNGTSYTFETVSEISSDNASTEYIPVGYVISNNKKSFGQNGSYSTSLIAEASKNQSLYPDLFLENCNFTLVTSNSSSVEKSSGKYYLNFTNSLSLTSGYNLNYFYYQAGVYVIKKTDLVASRLSLFTFLTTNSNKAIDIKVNPTQIVLINNTYQFNVSFEVSEANIYEEYIPVGYLTVLGNTYYGQDGSYCCSLYSEVKNNFNLYPDLFMSCFSPTVETKNNPTITKVSTSYYLNYTTEIALANNGDLSNISYEAGLYFIDKDYYENNPSTSFNSFIKNNSSSYIRKVVYTGSLAKNDGKYSFTCGISIDDLHYKTQYIPLGYLKINTNVILGQDSEYFANSLYAEALKNSELYPDICTELSTINLRSTSKTFELINDTPVADNISFAKSKNGYYKITANRYIKYFFIDGVNVNKSLNKNQTVYVNYINGTPTFLDSEHDAYFGFSAPNKEVWHDANSNPLLNTYANNAQIFSAMKGKCARIWISPASLYYGPGQAHPIYHNNDFTTAIKPQATQYVKDTIAAYRAVGIKEIILLVNGFYYTNDDEVAYVTDPGTSGVTDKIVDGHVANSISKQGGCISWCSIFPQNTYNKFLDNNKKFYKLLADTFDCDCIEFANEINLNPYKYDLNYHLNKATYDANSGIIPLDDQDVYRNEVIGYISDYCKAATDGVKLSTRKNIKVLTPAIAGVCDETRNDQWGKPTRRDAAFFIEGMYKYIKNTKKADVKDYFQGINLHPYIFNGYETPRNDCYLFTKNSMKDEYFNANCADDWKAYMDSLHNISVTYGDELVSAYATEFGFTDYAGSTGSWKTLTDAKYIPTAIENTLPLMKNMDYFAGLYWFRLYSFEISVGNDGEPNFGFVSKNKTLKTWGYTLYKQYTGESSVPQSFINLLANLEENTDSYQFKE